MCMCVHVADVDMSYVHIVEKEVLISSLFHVSTTMWEKQCEDIRKMPKEEGKRRIKQVRKRGKIPEKAYIYIYIYSF